jgi:hypothetical protein
MIAPLKPTKQKAHRLRRLAQQGAAMSVFVRGEAQHGLYSGIPTSI